MSAFLRFRCVLFSCLLLVFSCQASAQRKKVGLVLGGGGAKGAAEIGVLKVLEEADIPIDYIVGTSIGSIVGGLYSIGYNAHELDSLYRSQDWLFLLKDEVNRKDWTFLSREEREKYLLHVSLSGKKKPSLLSGAVAGQNIYNLFSNLTIGYHNVPSFSKLPIPFSCVAVDIVSGNEVILDSGSLPMAMRSSMSIPGVFLPVERGNGLLIDGGALNNFPADIVKKMGADILIGVDLSTGWKKKEDLYSMSNLVSQLINIMGKEKYLANRKMVDLYINPDLKGFTPSSFQKTAIDSMINRGEKSARAHWNDLMELRKRIYVNVDTVTGVTVCRSKIQRSHNLLLNQVKIVGIRDEEEKWLRKKIGIEDHSEIKLSDIDEVISRLQGLDIFSKVEYVLSDNSPYDLTFVLEEKDFNHLNLGFRFDSEEVASMLINISNTQRLTTNHHFAVTSRISMNPYLQIDYDYGSFYNRRLELSYRINYHDFKLYSHSQKEETLSFFSQSLKMQYVKAYNLWKWQAGLYYDYYHLGGYLYNTDYKAVDVHPKSFFNYFTGWSMDSFDKRYFPQKGGKVDMKATLYTDNFARCQGSDPVAALSFRAETALALSSRLYMLPLLKGRFLFGNDIPAIYQNYVGGNIDERYLDNHLVWESAQNVHIVNNHFISGRLAFRYWLFDKMYLTALGEYGKDSRLFNSVLKGHEYRGYAARISYNTLLGPIEAQFNYSNLYKNIGFYLQAGFSF